MSTKVGLSEKSASDVERVEGCPGGGRGGVFGGEAIVRGGCPGGGRGGVFGGEAIMRGG